jgi:hypothetical protein
MRFKGAISENDSLSDGQIETDMLQGWTESRLGEPESPQVIEFQDHSQGAVTSLALNAEC